MFCEKRDRKESRASCLSRHRSPPPMAARQRESHTSGSRAGESLGKGRGSSRKRPTSCPVSPSSTPAFRFVPPTSSPTKSIALLDMSMGWLVSPRSMLLLALSMSFKSLGAATSFAGQRSLRVARTWGVALLVCRASRDPADDAREGFCSVPKMQFVTAIFRFRFPTVRARRRCP